MLISSTAPTAAFKFDNKLDNPMAMYLNDVATIPANMTGAPAISVLDGVTLGDGLPVGIQVLAPAREDKTMHATAALVETQPATSNTPMPPCPAARRTTIAGKKAAE